MRRSTDLRASGSRDLFQRLRLEPWGVAFGGFLRSPLFIIIVSALTAVFNLLGLDIVTYTVIIFFGVSICLFCVDLLPLMGLVMLCYVAPSPSNNPGSASNTGSIFYPENGGIYLLFLLAAFILALVYRMVTDPQIGWSSFIKTRRRLLGSMLLLCGGYLLSGLGIDQYPQIFRQNLLFSVMQCAAICVMYVLFAGTVRWEETPRDYLAWVGMCIGFVVIPQLLENYLSGRIFMAGTDTIDRELIYTGWGMHNNMGAMMAMMLPCPFYLARYHKRGWIFTILATALMVGVVLSCSRTSIMVGVAVYALCSVLLLRRKDQRKMNLLIYLAAALSLTGFSIIFFDKLKDIFDLFFEELFIVSQRDNLFHYGNKQFMSAPVFGGSFFPQGEYVPWDWSTSASFSSFFPPRWHNTVVQIAASCGIVGLLAYAIHRIDTIRLFLRERSRENLYIAMSIGVLLACSMLDCHFFNIGPVLYYSMALAFAEKIGKSRL